MTDARRPRIALVLTGGSLNSLGTDRLDVVLLHSDGNDAWVLRESGGLQELERMRSAGMIRAIGASTKTLEGALAAVELCGVVMLTVNAGYTDEVPAVEAAGKRGVGVILKKALASGHGLDGGTDEALAAVLRPAWARSVSSVVIGTTKAERVRENAASVERVLGSIDV